MAATKEGKIPHIYIFPMLAYGHMLPALDIAKMFAFRGLKVTIVTTPVNEPVVSKTINKYKELGFRIGVETIEFPAAEVGLPEGTEQFGSVSNAPPDVVKEYCLGFFKGLSLLRQPFELLLEQHRPDFIVADFLFPWTTDAGAKFGIPRVVFHGTCFFSLCIGDYLKLYEPHKKVSAADEQFLVPKLPGNIKISRNQIFNVDNEDDGNVLTRTFKDASKADSESYGVIVNSFYELESDYADSYRNELGRKAWHIGPCSLVNEKQDGKAKRGIDAAIDEHECLKWLGSKKTRSVVYVCFGSLVGVPPAQLKEIALGLEASGQDFIWVISKTKKEQSEKEDWIPDGFEDRIAGKGLIVRGWAPQLLILDHEAVGGFVTHCGWNSTLEGITAGLPMVTWPAVADQFFNEVLVTQVLKIGISTGVKCWMDFVKSEAIKDTVTRIMEGEEAEEIRRKAKELKEMARKAVEEGGSSYSDFNALIEEIKAHCIEASSDFEELTPKKN